MSTMQDDAMACLTRDPLNTFIYESCVVGKVLFRQVMFATVTRASGVEPLGSEIVFDIIVTTYGL